jgi:hypothetical protein
MEAERKPCVCNDENIVTNTNTVFKLILMTLNTVSTHANWRTWVPFGASLSVFLAKTTDGAFSIQKLHIKINKKVKLSLCLTN